ncbi:MAG: Obg family GTPase CgtA [Patescibacteria group bacterium]
MFVDTVSIIIKAGSGGDGAATLQRTAQTSKGGPDGGNGGNGGNVYFQGSHNLTDLRQFRYKKKIVAENGINGGAKNAFGRNAPHIAIYLPWGTKVTDLVTGQVYEITNSSPILIAQGGIGGRGNVAFKTATNRTPRQAEKGTKGQERTVLLDLRLIAQVGLIGLPNAGKSSLLAVLTSATPKIGNYPFTTLDPTVGMLGRYTIADLPGLIEGASTGKGLGIKFLKHIEKTKMLVHCIDCTQDHPEKAYEIVRQEFEEFNPQLLEKPEIILLTKVDLVDKKIVKKFTLNFAKKGKTVRTSSIYDPKSISGLKEYLISMLS